MLKYDRGSGFDWKFSFLAGFIAAPVLLKYFYGNSFTVGDYNVVMADSDWITLQYNGLTSWLLGGFLVGFGTRLSNGCDSVHGLGGVARLSKRSIVATVIFIATAMATYTIKEREGLFKEGSSFGRTYDDIHLHQ